MSRWGGGEPKLHTREKEVQGGVTESAEEGDGIGAKVNGGGRGEGGGGGGISITTFQHSLFLILDTTESLGASHIVASRKGVPLLRTPLA